MLRLLMTIALALTALFATATMALARVWESSSTMDPDWQIIFTNFDLRYGQVAQIMNLDGSDIQPLDLHLMPVTHTDCSPDGNTLAFVAGNHLYTTLATGENRHRFDERRIPNISDLGVSNSGSQIIFAGRLDGSFGIYLLNAENSHELHLTNLMPPEAGRYGDNYDLSAEGSLITYSTPEQFAVLRTDGTELIELPGQVVDGIWSPDGNTLAFAANWDGNFDIYIMDMDHSLIRQLTYLDGDSGYRFPSWSPDGRFLIFLTWGGLGVGGAIHVINIDGSGQRLLRDSSIKAETVCFLTARPTLLIANP
jgi:Tol biopolymer transport system component